MNEMLDTRSLFSLEGTAALVTGATGGIGLATATALAGAGAVTVLTGLAEQHPEEVARRLADAGLPVEGVSMDVNNQQEMADVVTAVVSRHGRLDTVFANAGVALDTGPHVATTDAQLDEMFDVNVRSVLHLANVAIPRMAENDGGTFLIMSSIAGVRGNKALGGYALTKAANAQLARNLAVQWGPQNVRVNALAPGLIATDMTRSFVDNHELAAARIERTPLRRFGQMHHIAGTVVYLASEAGSFVSGQTIIIDGGTVIND